MKQEPNQPEVAAASGQPEVQQRKWGEGALAATWRQGHKEIGQALKATPDSIGIVEEPGGFSNVPAAGVSQQAGYTQPVSHAPNSGVPHATIHGEVEQKSAPQHSFQSSLGQVIDRLHATEPSPQMSKEISQ